jgi:outer membrane murein-binding lipoprotein Lpp
MRTIASKSFLWTLLILLIAVAIPATGNTVLFQPRSGVFDRAQAAQKDSAGQLRMSNVNEMAKRVDSLQFIVVYNAQLLLRDFDSKVIWIYVMLGVMIIASMMMYGALNQAHRQRKDLEERLFNSLSSSVSELETKIKHVESEIGLQAPPKRSAAPRKKRYSRR